MQKKSFEKVKETERNELLNNFKTLADYEKQKAYLYLCIAKATPKRRRPRNNARAERGGKTFSYTYQVLVDGNRIDVYVTAFKSFHGIGDSRLNKIRSAFDTGSLKDKRGHHQNHSHIPFEIKMQIINHIESIPARESNYSRKNNQKINFCLRN